MIIGLQLHLQFATLYHNLQNFYRVYKLITISDLLDLPPYINFLYIFSPRTHFCVGESGGQLAVKVW